MHSLNLDPPSLVVAVAAVSLAVGLPAAEGMLKMLDVAEGKTLALALEATGLPDAQALSAAIDAAELDRRKAAARAKAE